MGKVLTRNYTLTTTRPRKASVASVSPYTIKLACGWPQCPKAFVRRGDLKRHEQLHTGVKNHECPECKKKFSQNSGLKTHMNVHTGHKPYRCTYEGCGAEFGDPSSHARHKKETHLVDYRYECPVEKCGSAIKRRSAFAQHLKKHNIAASSDELDDMKKAFRPPTQRRKSGQSDLPRTTAPNPAHFYYADSVDRNFISLHPDNKHSKTTEEQNDTLPPRATVYDHKVEAEYYLHPDHLHQRDVEPFFTAPTLSSSTFSTFSAQSSTETLVDDLKYEDFTNAKLFYNDVADHTQTIDPMVHLTTSISPSPTTSPFKKDDYRLSPTPLSIQELQKINSQMAYDRQRYTHSAMATANPSHVPYQLNHKLYTIPQEKNINYPQSHLNMAQQNPAPQWGPWGFV